MVRDEGRRHRVGARVVDFVVAPGARARDVGVVVVDATARVIIGIDAPVAMALEASSTDGVGVDRGVRPSASGRGAVYLEKTRGLIVLKRVQGVTLSGSSGRGVGFTKRVGATRARLGRARHSVVADGGAREREVGLAWILRVRARGRPVARRARFRARGRMPPPVRVAASVRWTTRAGARDGGGDARARCGRCISTPVRVVRALWTRGERARGGARETRSRPPPREATARRRTTSRAGLSLASSDDADDSSRLRARGVKDVRIGSARLRRLELKTYRALLVALVTLGFPALMNSLNEPVVSMLETVLVARVGTVFVAALAPASALFGLVEEVCFAFGVVVTTAVSTLRAEADTQEKVRETVSLSVFASFICGTICALGLQALYGPICKIMVVPQEVDALLRTYTIVRCLGLPLFSAANALEGVFLGSKDAIVPMVGWLTAGVMTACLQLFFITPKLDPTSAVVWAGLALTLGQAFVFFYLWYLAHRQGTYSLRSVFRNAKADGGVFARMYKRLNEQQIISEFGWLIISACARMSTYIIITSCATNIGVIQAAVNKTLLDLYILCGLCAEPVFTVGNVLLPRVRRKGEALLTSRRALFYIAILMGTTLVAAAYYVCGTSMLSADPNVRVHLNHLKPVVASTIGLSCASYALDGCVIGTGNAKFVATAQMVNTAFFVLLFCCFKLAFGAAITLQHLWTSLFMFQALRFVEHAWKLVKDERAFGRRVSIIAA